MFHTKMKYFFLGPGNSSSCRSHCYGDQSWVMQVRGVSLATPTSEHTKQPFLQGVTAVWYNQNECDHDETKNHSNVISITNTRINFNLVFMSEGTRKVFLVEKSETNCNLKINVFNSRKYWTFIMDSFSYAVNFFLPDLSKYVKQFLKRCVSTCLRGCCFGSAAGAVCQCCPSRCNNSIASR